MVVVRPSDSKWRPPLLLYPPLDPWLQLMAVWWIRNLPFLQTGYHLLPPFPEAHLVGGRMQFYVGHVHLRFLPWPRSCISTRMDQQLRNYKWVFGLWYCWGSGLWFMLFYFWLLLVSFCYLAADWCKQTCRSSWGYPWT